MLRGLPEKRVSATWSCDRAAAAARASRDGERIVGVIDFDAAHTGPRLRDIAYAVYRFAPLADPSSEVAFGSVREQAERARYFCDRYGLADRSPLVAALCERLWDLVAFMRSQAANGTRPQEAPRRRP